MEDSPIVDLFGHQSTIDTKFDMILHNTRDAIYVVEKTGTREEEIDAAIVFGSHGGEDKNNCL